ncbi:glutamate racemase [Anaerococcus provencensis]|uniref:glutamate racemase n=1 Tax=Anaerococcus provencensis TaxID=938293 RepID=UPI0002F49D68|nr:glutamate racemase [Anaerococcus provencensis]
MTNIGVFDSGLGGLTVLQKLIKTNKANYYYFGDSLRAPYGNRDKTEIIKFAEEIVDFLQGFDIDYYIIACNTISALASKHLSDKYKKKFYPITDAGIEATKLYDGDFLVLGTKATINSHFYKNNIQNNSKVYEVAGIKLVDYIENGKTSGYELDKSLGEYLEIANKEKIENIILACTHYPIITDAIRKNLTYQANIIDPADYLKLDLPKNDESSVNIYMSKIDPNTEKIIKNLIDCDYNLVEKEL